MKLLSYRRGNAASYGMLNARGGVVDLAKRMGSAAPTLKDCLAGDGVGRLSRFATEPADFDIGQVELLPVVPDPAHIVCVGLNYEEHRAETKRAVAAHPTIFMRVAESLQAQGKPLLIPRESDQFDFEGELAVIMGRVARRVSEADAWSYVAGVSCANDATVRDWQYHTHQFGPGKNFPLTGALGPVLVTPDELPQNKVMTLQTRVNGEVVQRADTGQMIFPVPRLLAYVSTFMTLLPGDVILTGTPGGVGAKRQPPLWLRDGDVVEVEIEHVGLLSNPCQKEK